MKSRQSAVPVSHVSVYKGSYALQKHINSRQCNVELAEQATLIDIVCKPLVEMSIV